MGRESVFADCVYEEGRMNGHALAVGLLVWRSVHNISWHGNGNGAVECVSHLALRTRMGRGGGGRVMTPEKKTDGTVQRLADLQVVGVTFC